MKGYHLYIFRHGRTEANSEGSYIGVTDLPLSEEGREELVEKYESSIYPRVQKVYSSPLTRCIETAEILFPDRFIQKVDGLREMDFGEFEGKNVRDLAKAPAYKEWLKGGLDSCPPGGESLREMMLRSYKALEEIFFDMMNEGMTHCGIVTHGGIIMNMLSCFGLPKMKPMEFACEIGEGYEILITTQLWQNSGAFEILGKLPYDDNGGENDFEEDYD